MTEIADFVRAAKPLDYRSWLASSGLDLARAALGRNDGWMLTRSRSGRIAVASRWQHLPWDSERLGFPCARVDDIFIAKDASTADRLQWAEEMRAQSAATGVRFLTCRIGCEDIASARALEAVGFRIADCLFVYEARGDGSEPADGFPADGQQFVERGIATMQHGRLLDDANVPDASARDIYVATSLYHIENGATVAVVRDQSGAIEGMAIGVAELGVSRAIGAGFGYLWLILVHPERRGTGIGKRVLERFLRQMGPRAERIEVSTQAGNAAASALYRKMGFTMVTQVMTFHAWL
jgi:ribosomal protein S18 acetylase RimI-like enzyme